MTARSKWKIAALVAVILVFAVVLSPVHGQDEGLFLLDDAAVTSLLDIPAVEKCSDGKRFRSDLCIPENVDAIEGVATIPEIVEKARRSACTRLAVETLDTTDVDDLSTLLDAMKRHCVGWDSSVWRLWGLEW
ncbi:MAG: hypothetical protein OXI95_15300 [bacterium]|nr:hypothetical protein [bacterium]